MSDRKRMLVAWGPAIFCMAAIFFLSSQSKLPEPPLVGGFDKAQHFIAYFVLGTLALRGALMFPLKLRIGPYIQALILASLYGASDEFHQHFVPGRTMDVRDWLADTAGALIALALVWLYYHYIQTKRNGGSENDGLKRRKGSRGNRTHSKR